MPALRIALACICFCVAGGALPEKRKAREVVEAITKREQTVALLWYAIDIDTFVSEPQLALLTAKSGRHS